MSGVSIPRLLAEGKTLPFDEVFIIPQPARGTGASTASAAASA